MPEPVAASAFLDCSAGLGGGPAPRGSDILVFLEHDAIRAGLEHHWDPPPPCSLHGNLSLKAAGCQGGEALLANVPGPTLAGLGGISGTPRGVCDRGVVGAL